MMLKDTQGQNWIINMVSKIMTGCYCLHYDRGCYSNKMKHCDGEHHDRWLWQIQWQIAMAWQTPCQVDIDTRYHYTMNFDSLQQIRIIQNSSNQYPYKLQWQWIKIEFTQIFTCITYKLMFDDIDLIQQIHAHVHVKERKKYL